MKNYFKLYEECFLVRGSKISGIYNLLNGNVYEITNAEADIVELCEKDYSIDEISIEFKLNISQITLILDKIEKNSLGLYSEHKVFINKFIFDNSWIKYFFKKMPISIQSSYIVLENICNNNCLLCTDNFIKKYPCMGCFTRKNPPKRTTYQQYILALNILHKQGVENIYFTGGNIFNNWEQNLSILREAVSLNFKHIYVFIGGNQELSSVIVEELKELNVSLCVCIEILDTKLIDNKLLTVLEKSNNISSIYIYFASNIENEHALEVVNNYKDKYKFTQIYADRVYNKNNLSLKDKQELHYLSKTSLADFSTKTMMSPCLNGIITVNEDSTIGVCPRMNEFSVCEINDFDKGIKQSDVDELWSLNKDKVNKCNSCHLRYVCDDCRYIEYKIGSDIKGMFTCPN